VYQDRFNLRRLFLSTQRCDYGEEYEREHDLSQYLSHPGELTTKLSGEGELAWLLRIQKA
jgi:hypothetical protein